MTSNNTTAPPPPSAPRPGIPADFNRASDFWFYEIGISVIPAKTKIKKTFTEWLQYQNAPVSEEQHNEWKRTNAYADGIAFIPGRVWRGPQRGKYFTFLDLDNQKAIDEFCSFFKDKNGQAWTLQELARKFIVEQHVDNPSKAHVYFYSEIPFVKRGSDESNPKFKPEEQPAFEVKGLGSHGIAYCTPSVHKDGHPYQIIGTVEPVCLDKSQAQEMMQRLASICRKYDLHYLENDDGSGKTKIPMDSLYEEEFRIYEGNNRHQELMRFMESMLKKNAKKLHLPINIIYDLCRAWNQRCCVPPLDDNEFERQWKDASKFINKKLEEEREGEEGEEKDDDDDNDNKSTIRAVQALELAKKESQEIFIDDFGRPFAAMKMLDGHVEVHPMDESKFKNWISGLYYSIYDKLLIDEDLKKIVRILMSKAEFDGSIPRRKLDLRVRGYDERQYLNYDDGNDNNNNNGVSSGSSVGSFGDSLEDFDAIYYDLTNKKWEAIKITPEGWEIDKHPPFLFRRYGAELPQAYPDRNNEPDVLDQFLELWNIKQDENKDTQKLLNKVDTITDFWPNTTPKPAIILPSAQGSAKTTAFELRRDLVDPNTALTMSIPKDDNQFKQALAHNYLSFFDNVSDITDSQSDIMCRGVTGSGDFKRKLFENDEDVIYSYRRRIGLNGISNVITKPDLLERGLYVEFGQIPKNQRELLRIIRRKHLALKPKVLAFCLDVISEVMAERKKWKGIDEDYFGMKDLIKKNGGLPRMADWSILGEQIAAIIARKEGKEYEPGAFLKAFDENIKILNTEALKASLVAEGLIAFMTNRAVLDHKTEWEGSPTMLSAELNSFIALNSDSIKINTRAKAWPQDPSVFGKELAKIASNLRPLGIEIESKKTNQNTQYRITILPPLLPLPTHIRNEEKNVMSVGSGGSGSKYENLGGEMIQKIANRAMSDGNGGSKGYFTWNEAKTVLMCLPVQDPLHCDENQADQTLQALKEEGKISELEPGKYAPAGGLGGGN